MSATYSFLDVNCTLVGPGGSLILSESGVADEGITIEMADDKTSMLTGATRGGMHSLHASNAARITVRLLKNSPLNAKLNAMYRLQGASSATTGRNVFSMSNAAWGDDHTCSECAFTRHPTVTNSKAGAMMEWTWNSLDADTVLGDGSLLDLI